MTWPSMMSVRKIGWRRPTCRRLVWREAIRDHLLLASGYSTWTWIGLIGVRRVARGIVDIRTAIMLWWASGIALPFFVGVHTFRRLRRR